MSTKWERGGFYVKKLFGKKILKVLLVLLILASGFLILLSRCATRSFDNLNQEIESLTGGPAAAGIIEPDENSVVGIGNGRAG